MGFLFNRLGFFMSDIISSFVRLFKLDIHQNLLATVIPGQGRAVAGGVPPLCGENGFNKKFLPDPPHYKQVHTDDNGTWTALA